MQDKKITPSVESLCNWADKYNALIDEVEGYFQNGWVFTGAPFLIVSDDNVLDYRFVIRADSNAAVLYYESASGNRDIKISGLLRQNFITAFQDKPSDAYVTKGDLLANGVSVKEHPYVKGKSVMYVCDVFNRAYISSLAAGNVVVELEEAEKLYHFDLLIYTSGSKNLTIANNADYDYLFYGMSSPAPDTCTLPSAGFHYLVISRVNNFLIVERKS